MEFVWFLWIREQAANFALYNIKRLVFITQADSVYCAVRRESLYNQIRFVYCWWEKSTIMKFDVIFDFLTRWIWTVKMLSRVWHSTVSKTASSVSKKCTAPIFRTQKAETFLGTGPSIMCSVKIFHRAPPPPHPHPPASSHQLKIFKQNRKDWLLVAQWLRLPFESVDLYSRHFMTLSRKTKIICNTFGLPFRTPGPQ